MENKRLLLRLDMQTKLSTLWIFVLLNVIFRDIHDLFRPGVVADIIANGANGTAPSEELMLMAGVMLEIVILMVILSRFLTYRANRLANIVAGAATMAFIVSNGVHDLDDLFFTAVEVTALAFVIWSAWRWREAEDADERVFKERNLLDSR